MKERVAPQLTSVQNVVALAGLVAVCLTSSVGTTPAPVSDTLAQRVQQGKVAAAPAQIALNTSPAAAAVSPF